MFVHGEPKKGKTWFGATAPKPLLVLDAEAGGFRHVPGRHIRWDPLGGEDIPEWDDDWDICRVTVSHSLVIETVKDYIIAGDHPFKSIVIDSLTEVQDRMKREFNVGADLEQKHWGIILMKLEDAVKDFRDAVEHQEQLEAFVVICATRERGNKMRPFLSGQIADKVGYFLDAEAYLFTQHDEDGDIRRGLRLVGDSKIEAGARGMDVFGEVVWDPNLEEMLSILKENEK